MGLENNYSPASLDSQAAADTGYQYGYGEEAAAVMSDGWNNNLFSKAMQSNQITLHPDEKQQIIDQNTQSRQENENIIQNSPQTFTGGSINALGGLASMAIDPSTIPLAILSDGISLGAKAAIPSLETERIAASYGNVAAKFSDGAVHGLGFMVPYSSTKAILSQQLEEPYTLSDSAQDIFGGVFLGSITEGSIEGLSNFFNPKQFSRIAQEATASISSGSGFDLNGIVSLHPDVVTAELSKGSDLSPESRMALLKATLHDDRPIGDIFPGVDPADVQQEIRNRAVDLMDSIQEKKEEPILKDPVAKSGPTEETSNTSSGVLDKDTEDFLHSNGADDLVHKEPAPKPKPNFQDYIESSKKNNPLPFEEGVAKVKDESGRSRTEYDENGNIQIVQGSDKGFEEHEIIHAAHLKALADDWKAEGSKGSFIDYVNKRATEIHDDILNEADKATKVGDTKSADAIKQAVADSIKAYDPSKSLSKNKALDYLKNNPEKVPQFVAEMVRQFVELRNGGKLSDPAFKGTTDKLVEWAKKAYSRLLGLKESVGDGRLGDSLAKAIKQTEAKLKSVDHSDVKPSTEKGVFFAPKTFAEQMGRRVFNEYSIKANEFIGKIKNLDKQYAADVIVKGTLEKNIDNENVNSDSVMSEEQYKAERNKLQVDLKKIVQDRQKNKDLWNFLAKNESKMAKAFEYFLDSGADLKGVSGARIGTHQYVEAVADTYTKAIENAFKGTKFFKAAISGKLDKEFCDAMHALDTGDTSNISKIDPQMMEAFKKCKAIQEEIRQRANRSGASINKFDGYVSRTTHDQDKIARAGVDEKGNPNKAASESAMKTWVSDIKNSLHPDHQISDEALKESWWNLITGNHLKDPVGQILDGPVGSGLAGKMSHSKTFIFKDSDAWREYNQKYGQANAFQSFIIQTKQMSRGIGLLEKIGTDPMQSVKDNLSRVSDVLRQNEDYEGVKDLKARENLIVNMAKNLTGENNVGVTNTVSRIGAGLRALQSFKLGGIVASALPDVRGTLRNAQHLGIPLSDAMQSLAETLKNKLNPSEQKEVAGLFEMTHGDFSAHIARQGEGAVDGAIGKLAQKYISYTGIHIWDDGIKQWMTNMLSRHLGNNAEKTFDELGDSLRTMLSARQISSSEWNDWRSGVQDVGGGKALGLDKYEAGFDKESMATLAKANGRPSDTPLAVQKYRDELYTKLRAMFVDEASFAVPHGGARERAMIIGDSVKGTVWGEVRRCVGEFKTFPVAAVTKIGAREWNSYSTLQSHMSGIAFHLATCAAAGYLSMQVKNVIGGKSPEAPTGAPLLRGLVSAGAGGIYGDLLYSNLMESNYGQGLLETLAGPALGSAAQGVKIAAEALHDKSQAKTDALKMMKSSFTFPVFKGALDYAIWNNLLEYSHPGYLKAVREKALKEGTPLVAPQALFYGQ